MDQKWFRASAVFLAVVVVAAILLAWAPWASTGESSADSGGGEAGASVPASPDSESKCGLAAGDQSIPTTAGPEVSWELIGRIAAPSAPALGPGEVDDGLRGCYAKSPAGALLAAANYAVQASTPELALRNVQENMASGKGQEAVLAMMADAASPIGGGDSLSVQIAGFLFIEYTGDTALIEIVARGSNGVMLSTPTGVVWEDGDWKIAVQDNGQSAVPPRVLPSLTGYVLWSGA